MRCRKLKSEPGAGKDIVSSFEFRVSSCLFGEVDAARSLNSELETRNSKLETIINESWESRSIPLWSERTGAAVREAELPLP